MFGYCAQFFQRGCRARHWARYHSAAFFLIFHLIIKLVLMTEQRIEAAPIEVARLLLDFGVLLLQSGAHTGRIIRNLQRIGASFDYQPEIFVAFSGITLTLRDKHGIADITLFGRVANYGVHLATVAAISQLSWQVSDQPISISELRERLYTIKLMPHYSRWQIIPMIGLACGALARLSHAPWSVVVVAALAAATALWLRMWLQRHKFNGLLVVLFAALFATLVGSSATLLHVGDNSHLAIAASVLFLIPGVPLINAVIDMINGYMTMGIGRGAAGIAISMALAGGMLTGMQWVGVSI